MDFSSIGGLKILEIGASEICHNPFGQSIIYMHVMDSNNKQYIFKGDIGNSDYGFFIYPAPSKKPKINDLQWCRKWCWEHCRNLSREEYKKTVLVLNKYDYNRIFSMLGYNGNKLDSICAKCGKKVSDWWFSTDYICSDCVKDESEFIYKY